MSLFIAATGLVLTIIFPNTAKIVVFFNLDSKNRDLIKLIRFFLSTNPFSITCSEFLYPKTNQITCFSVIKRSYWPSTRTEINNIGKQIRELLWEEVRGFWISNTSNVFDFSSFLSFFHSFKPFQSRFQRLNSNQLPQLSVFRESFVTKLETFLKILFSYILSLFSLTKWVALSCPLKKVQLQSTVFRVHGL